MKYILFMLVVFPFTLFATPNPENIQASLIVHKLNSKKESLDYKIVKSSEDNKEYYKLKLRDPNKNSEKKISSGDAKLLISLMNDMAWNFEFKDKKKIPTCISFAEMEVSTVKTSVCSKEKMKAAQVLGLVGRLNFLLK